MITVLVAGCSEPAPTGSASGTKDEFRIDSERVSRAEADLSVLFIGNSHTSTHDVPLRFAALVRADMSGAKVFTKTCTSSPFLVDHANNAKTLEAIDNGPWDYVVLQAQKYSTTGKYLYPYDATIKLSKLAKQQGAQVIMFPEWGRQGNPDEAQRVHQLHHEIAEITRAHVAPVGLAWDRAQAAHPGIQFHQGDGNHASPIGAYLTACVLYATMTGRNPEEIPSEGHLQPSLQSIAWETVHRQPRSPSSLKPPRLQTKWVAIDGPSEPWRAQLRQGSPMVRLPLSIACRRQLGYRLQRLWRLTAGQRATGWGTK